MRAFMITALLLGGCAASYGGRQIGGTDWVARDINGVAPVAGTAPTLRLSDGLASGSAGCNSFSGSFQRLSRERLRIGPLSTTRKACGQAAMEQEQRYLAILGSAEGYSFYADGGFSLIAADGRAIRFRRP